MPVRPISSSTAVGRPSSWPRSDRSSSESVSSAGWRTGVSSDEGRTSRTRGPSSSRMSSTVSTGPCKTSRIRAMVRRGWKGYRRVLLTAKTSRFCSMA